jgi:hypothetical protein
LGHILEASLSALSSKNSKSGAEKTGLPSEELSLECPVELENREEEELHVMKYSPDLTKRGQFQM